MPNNVQFAKWNNDDLSGWTVESMSSIFHLTKSMNRKTFEQPSFSSALCFLSSTHASIGRFVAYRQNPSNSIDGFFHMPPRLRFGARKLESIVAKSDVVFYWTEMNKKNTERKENFISLCWAVCHRFSIIFYYRDMCGVSIEGLVNPSLCVYDRYEGRHTYDRVRGKKTIPFTQRHKWGLSVGFPMRYVERVR